MDSWKSSPQKMKTHYEFARLCIFLKDKQIQNGNFEWLKIFFLEVRAISSEGKARIQQLKIYLLLKIDSPKFLLKKKNDSNTHSHNTPQIYDYDNQMYGKGAK